MQQIRAVFESRPTGPKKPNLPKIDHEELHRFDADKNQRNWALPVVLAAIVFASFSIGWRLFRRRGLWIILFALIPPIAGCDSHPISKLSTNFEKEVILYAPPQNSLRPKLIVRNVGNVSLTIHKLDAGCSCRQADDSKFPLSLSPGESKPVEISLSGLRTFQPQRLTFTFSTDKGTLISAATIFTLPRHHLSPDSITFSDPVESNTHVPRTFELTHREVKDKVFANDVKLELPPELSSEQLSVKESTVSHAPNLLCRDTTFRIGIQDRAVGLHRAEIDLKGQKGQKVLSVPIVWQNLPFLSTIPEKAILTDRPSRVFLRCLDETVEIARVLSSPRGVKVVQDSPRSVTFSLTDEAPEILDEYVEIESTSNKHDRLKVPVVRYNAKSSK
jgi:hypothetical protein